LIIACGLYLLAEEEKRKKRKLWVHKVFRAREEEGEFHTLFGRLKDDRQKFYKHFRMSVSKFDNLKQLLHTVIEKKNTRSLLNCCRNLCAVNYTSTLVLAPK
jgi:hypothetical protein